MLDDELAALWQAETAQARDPGFDLAVIRRLERDLFQRRIAATLAIAAIMTLFLALAMPALTGLLRHAVAHYAVGPVLSILLTGIGALLSAARRAEAR